MPTQPAIYSYSENSGRPQREPLKKVAEPTQPLYTVGTNGDFPSLNAAFEHLTNYITIGKPVEVRMLSGFVIEETLTFSGTFLGNVVLTSEDEITYLSREWALANSNTSGADFFIRATNSRLFKLGTHIRMDESGTPFTGNNNPGNYFGSIQLTNGSNMTFASSNDLNGKQSGLSNFMAMTNIQNSELILDFESFVNDTGNAGDYSFTGGARVWWNNIGVSQGSNLILSGAECSNSRWINISVTTGSRAYVQQSQVRGAVEAGILVGIGATASARLSNFRKDDGTEDSSKDIVIESSSFALIGSCNGGTSITPNELNINGEGLILRS